MAKRHNEYGRLLGTVENDVRPLKEQMPITNAPDLGEMADDCQAMGDKLHGHADNLRALSQMQPDWNDIAMGDPIEDIGLPTVDY